MRKIVFSLIAPVVILLFHTPQAFADQSSETVAKQCTQDGVTTLCLTVDPGPTLAVLTFEVTQGDGRGYYQFHYVDATTLLPSSNYPVGPLHYQETQFGQLTGTLGHCFSGVLVGEAGTSLTVGPVCA